MKTRNHLDNDQYPEQTMQASCGSTPGPTRVQGDAGPVKLPVVEGKDIRFTRPSTADGLSHSRVEHILQDDRGFMWFGTEDGLNRYDGYDFKVYKNEPVNANSHVLSIYEDRAVVLWVGTMDTG